MRCDNFHILSANKVDQPPNEFFRSRNIGLSCHQNCKSFAKEPSKFDQLGEVCNKLDTISSKTIRMQNLQKLYPLFQEKAYHLQTIIVVRKGIIINYR